MAVGTWLIWDLACAVAECLSAAPAWLPLAVAQTARGGSEEVSAAAAAGVGASDSATAAGVKPLADAASSCGAAAR